ncbi:hypothetical protein DFH06DRAFT_1205759 [Mycena polygramma]|nr:hypothetical protein DFH06DRAFT_1205759 [Mycena polygramma]
MGPTTPICKVGVQYVTVPASSSNLYIDGKRRHSIFFTHIHHAHLAIVGLSSLVCAYSDSSSNNQPLPAPRHRVQGSVAEASNGLWKKETNASRLRRGLPPLPPTRRSSGIRARASTTPCTTPLITTGLIKVTFTDDKTTAYLSASFDRKFYTITSQPLNHNVALVVKLPDSALDGPFDIAPVAVGSGTVSDPLYPRVGAVGGPDFLPGQLEWAHLSATGHTDANSPPSSTAGSSLQSQGSQAPSESQIWSINCQTHEITAQWTNSDNCTSLVPGRMCLL